MATSTRDRNHAKYFSAMRKFQRANPRSSTAGTRSTAATAHQPRRQCPRRPLHQRRLPPDDLEPRPTSVSAVMAAIPDGAPRSDQRRAAHRQAGRDVPPSRLTGAGHATGGPNSALLPLRQRSLGRQRMECCLPNGLSYTIPSNDRQSASTGTGESTATPPPPAAPVAAGRTATSASLFAEQIGRYGVRPRPSNPGSPPASPSGIRNSSTPLVAGRLSSNSAGVPAPDTDSTGCAGYRRTISTGLRPAHSHGDWLVHFVGE